MSVGRDCVLFVRTTELGGRRVAEGIEIHVVVGDIETRVIENVERIYVISERESFTESEILGRSKVKAVLERPAEDVPSARRVTVFEGVAHWSSRTGITGRDA